jgi:hypothetical protein
MAVLAIDSNGLLERTAVYYNGSQISGIKELFLNLDENGTFDALIQYEGKNKQIYHKQIFSDYLDEIQTVPPSFTEEEAEYLVNLTIDSNGEIDDTTLKLNDEVLDGVVSLFLHIKASKNKSGFLSFLKKPDVVDSAVTFKAEITFRNEDETLETEDIFL